MATEVTLLLDLVRAGDQQALNELITLLYDELRGLAGRYMRHERQDHTLRPTALVHEAYLRLVGGERRDWRNRHHFLAAAAHAMRCLLVDHARARLADKRGARTRLPIETALLKPAQEAPDVLAVDEALGRLAARDERAARMVEMRYFGGLTCEEAAAVLGISARTALREWKLARAWLRGELVRPGSTS